jgi:ubiquinone/menaquinone biosynthesis C-methylase UbiE
MGAQVYAHSEKFLRPQSSILELNAGTGIYALHFINAGHIVHVIDLSDGMIAQIENKIQAHNLQSRLSLQQLSYDNLDLVNKKISILSSRILVDVREKKGVYFWTKKSRFT